MCAHVCVRARVCLCVCTWRPDVSIVSFLLVLHFRFLRQSLSPDLGLTWTGQWAPVSQPLQCRGYRRVFPGAGLSLLPSMHSLLLTNKAISPATDWAFSMWAVTLHASLRFVYTQKHLHRNEAPLAPLVFFFFFNLLCFTPHGLCLTVLYLWPALYLSDIQLAP